MVCPQDGFAAAGGASLRRQDAKPATNDATADAIELMVLAWLVSE